MASGDFCFSLVNIRSSVFSGHLFFQMSRWWSALRPQFSEGPNKSFQYSVHLAFLMARMECWHPSSLQIQLKPEAQQSHAGVSVSAVQLWEREATSGKPLVASQNNLVPLSDPKGSRRARVIPCHKARLSSLSPKGIGISTGHSSQRRDTWGTEQTHFLRQSTVWVSDTVLCPLHGWGKYNTPNPNSHALLNTYNDCISLYLPFQKCVLKCCFFGRC